MGRAGPGSRRGPRRRPGITFAKPDTEQRADAEAALAALAAGRLTPRIHAALPLQDAPLAHADLEGRRNVGAVLLKP
ncbi:zinc-binding dehydrogenase [Catenulispora sp. GP43]|uniref:zinc-binding dehydrogenase n=1 Tax=Catenulispora sp. GP43 TaxID=3156263 RepID=UPI003511A730